MTASLKDAMLKANLVTPEQAEKAELQKKKEADEAYGRRLMERELRECPPLLIPAIELGIKKRPDIFNLDNIRLFGLMHQDCKRMTQMAKNMGITEKGIEDVGRGVQAQWVLDCPAILPLIVHLTIFSLMAERQKDDEGANHA